MSSLPVIGVDLGGTKLLAGIVGVDGTIHARAERPTPVGSEEELLHALEEVVDDLFAGRDVAAVGFGIPSTIDRRTGEVVTSVHIPLGGVRLADRMRSRFGVPIAVDNDGNAATLAEWAIGAGRGTSHMIMLTLGTGIGGGLILGGRLYRGAVGAGGELGHMIVDHDGPPCGPGCRGHGHFEALASGRTADGRARELGLADARELVGAARAGDGRAVAALAEIGRAVGAGIASLVNVFNPEMIVIGGGFAAAGELILAPARDVLSREALSPGRDVVRVVLAELGRDAGLVGAGLAAYEALGAGSEWTG
ncbi:MAG: ROK family protein [Thermoleophilia bacterium]|nr:ROK family protein [Thermoleophilia bacterium]